MCKKAWCTCKDVFFFANLNLLFLCCSPSPLQKLPIVVTQKFCYHGKVTSHFSSLLNINLIFSQLLRRHIRTPRIVFLCSSRYKFHVREKLLMVNLQAKSSPFTYRTESLTKQDRTAWQGFSWTIWNLKKIKPIKTHIIYKHCWSQHNQQFPFQKQNKLSLKISFLAISMLTSVLAENRSKKENVGKR